MRSRFGKLIVISFLLSISLSVWAQTGANPALYQVTKGELKLFIVGSIHAGKGDFYPMTSMLEQVLTHADALYLEITPDEMTPEKLAKAMHTYAVLSTPVPLKRRMSDPTYQQLLTLIEKYHLPAHQLMFMQNWSIIIQLTVATISDMGLNKEFGVDHYFAQQAAKANKPVLGLETLDQQFGAISAMEKIEAEVLYSNLFAEMEHAAKWLSQIEQAWRNGNATELTRLYQEYDSRQQQAELMQTLLDDRNRNWLRKLTQLAGRKTYLVVVGDMHVHGNNNILQLLKQSGFSIQRLNPT